MDNWADFKKQQQYFVNKFIVLPQYCFFASIFLMLVKICVWREPKTNILQTFLFDL